MEVTSTPDMVRRIDILNGDAPEMVDIDMEEVDRELDELERRRRENYDNFDNNIEGGKSDKDTSTVLQGNYKEPVVSRAERMKVMRKQMKGIQKTEMLSAAEVDLDMVHWCRTGVRSCTS